MWHLRMWFRGGVGSAELTVGLKILKFFSSADIFSTMTPVVTMLIVRFLEENFLNPSSSWNWPDLAFFKYKVRERNF